MRRTVVIDFGFWQWIMILILVGMIAIPNDADKRSADALEAIATHLCGEEGEGP